MTAQATFKKRVRTRMATTGEKYAAARRVLIDLARSDGRMWVSEPEMSDDAIREGTGRGWNEWCDTIEAAHPDDVDHATVAAWVHDQVDDITHWWAQGVTVGWERITGRRLPYQQGDGLFAASKFRTIAVDADELRAILLDDEDRADLLGGLDTERRSRPTSKGIRIGMPEGVAELTLEVKAYGRTRVAVQHAQLPSHLDVPGWRAWWTEWLDALDTLAEPT